MTKEEIEQLIFNYLKDNMSVEANANLTRDS